VPSDRRVVDALIADRLPQRCQLGCDDISACLGGQATWSVSDDHNAVAVLGRLATSGADDRFGLPRVAPGEDEVHVRDGEHGGA
jgi:hypothetical protein